MTTTRVEYPRASTRLRLEALEARDVPAFVNPVTSPGGHNLIDDVNGDGKADLVAHDNTADKVSVRLGNGDGTFQPARLSNTGDGPYSMKAGDFNGDGKLDLVTVNSGDISLLIGRGDGSFLAPQSVPKPKAGKATQGVSDVGVTDLNKDGKDDLVLVGTVSTYTPRTGTASATATYVTAYKATNNGSFQAGPSQQVYSASDSRSRNGVPVYIPAAHAGDFNGDGNPDVFLADRHANGPSSCLLFGNGSGGLGSPRWASVGLGDAVVGDLDGDGDDDMVWSNNLVSNVRVQFSNGNGTFTDGGVVATGALVRVRLADINRDGRLDLVMANLNESQSRVDVRLGSGGGAFQPPLTVAGLPNQFFAITLADFDGDGSDDLALSQPDGNSSIYFNDRVW